MVANRHAIGKYMCQSSLQREREAHSPTYRMSYSSRQMDQVIVPKLYGHAIVSGERARLIVARVGRGTYNTEMYYGGWTGVASYTVS